MARVAITAIKSITGAQSLTVLANAADLTFTACDNSLGNKIACTGKEIILVWNKHAADAGTVTITAAADEHGRTGAITTYSLAAGEIGCFGMITTDPYRQASGDDVGSVQITGSAATMYVAVIRVP